MQNLQKTKQLGQEQEVGVNDPASLFIVICCAHRSYIREPINYEENKCYMHFDVLNLFNNTLS